MGVLNIEQTKPARLVDRAELPYLAANRTGSRQGVRY